MNPEFPGGARLLIAEPAGVDLAAHQHIYGPCPPVAPASQAAADLLAEVGKAHLRGRGGAWFPTALKMRGVLDNAARHRRHANLICNGMEGEPASHSDGWLLANAPHLVLDGMDLARAVVGAKRAILAMHDDSPHVGKVRTALAARPHANIELVTPPSRYVASEESALTNFVNTGDARPTYGHRPHQAGVNGWPTLVNNAETLAQLALIARFGGDWFANVGVTQAPGTTLMSVGGAVVRPQVFEVALGTPAGEVLAGCGGVVGDCTAVLTGGFGGTWAPLSRVSGLGWEPDGMRDAGIGIGSGILWVLPEHVCGLVETASVLRYLAGESAGQCGACAFGLQAIAQEFAALASGHSDAAALAELERHLAMIPRRGGCALPDGGVRMCQSALATFSEEVAVHISGRCSFAGVTHTGPHLPVPPAHPMPALAPGREWR